MRILLMVLAFVLSMLPRLVLAHPGHGTTDAYPLLHYLVEPEHAILLLTLGLALVLSRRAVRTP